MFWAGSLPTILFFTTPHPQGHILLSRDLRILGNDFDFQGLGCSIILRGNGLQPHCSLPVTGPKSMWKSGQELGFT